ncbi:MAG TPA: TIGR04282 family arsenosugar biosynthesis glycosyltransferase [Chryseolinea sp.]|jgi:rSAM/selenodomain-associated transferase 1|nr:TIGR04282 family arsenosugar biosynthesis glycosyltransferase [Chryseolinea sp.]
MMKQLLIVFIKNPILGKVKTRLAASLGDQKALRVYKKLLDHTLRITGNLEYDKIVYYSDFVPEQDEWLSAGFKQGLQIGQDLGQKMENAFEEGFRTGYSRILIIGSDCFELTSYHISKAFDNLENSNVVLGPATDGGYYLLGMTELFENVFENKKWSTDSVLRDTIKNLTDSNIKFNLLEQLNDIDTESDLQSSKIDIQ